MAAALGRGRPLRVLHVGRTRIVPEDPSLGKTRIIRVLHDFDRIGMPVANPGQIIQAPPGTEMFRGVTGPC